MQDNTTEMKNKYLAEKLKDIRKRKGLSQEALAENSKLSLRTIQRLENNETEPTAHTLRRISDTLNIDQEELTVREKEEDSAYLQTLNISTLTFFLFPLLGIITPTILWAAKKDRFRNLNKVATAIINFEITWNIILFAGLIFGSFIVSYKIESTGIIDMNYYQTRNQFYIYFISIMYLLHLLMIIINSFNLQKDRNVFYQPKINFIG